ncbi:ArsR/SmtB family transcription factor [Phaeacidiphilus oryzae]|uniref:ArsR/SmtB family transcription factor n=1 Tax=Phaeacidiphilus oryzae TaxID=348818 RepID=UPI00055BAD3F|nr:DUF5937 family protein [Phaeacidiphilus oryzae]
MPLLMRLGAEDLTRCRFAVSPLCETHEAVRTLHRPGRHPYHLPWLRRVRPAVERLDLAPLRLLMPPPGGYTPDFLGPPPTSRYAAAAGFGEELERMRATDPEVAREEMARALACTPGAADSPAGRALLADPAAAVRLLADLTEQAWEALLRADWPRVRSVLEADVAHRARELARSGLDGMFAGLHPGLDWSEGHVLTLDSRHHDQRDLDGRGILLMPSVFVWPDALSGFDPRWQPTLIYPARGIGDLWQPPPEPRPAPATAARPASEPLGDGGLGRLLGGTRAALLRDLAEPASTTDLALRHGLAPSSVSAHLAVLTESGLLTSHRVGRRVLYTRTPLGTALADGPDSGTTTGS